MQPNSENTEILLAKHFSNETFEESDLLNAFIESDPEAYAGYQKAWNNATPALFLDDTDTNTAWQRVKPKAAAKHRQLYWIGGIAASLITIAMITFFLVNRPERSTYVMLHETSTKMGETKMVNLPDGSTVKLNAGSTLRYPLSFDGNIREVYLEGEGFFQVTKNTRKPFIVRVEELDVKVHSTSFNIEAYKGMANLSVAVKTGKVTFSPTAKEASGVVLAPMQKGVYSVVTEEFVSVEADEADFAWIDNKIIFDQTSLSEAVTELNRSFNLNISLDNNEIGDCRISATFDNQHPEDVLNTILLMLNLESEKKGNGIVLKGEGCLVN